MRTLSRACMALACLLIASTAYGQVFGDCNENGMRDIDDLDLLCQRIGQVALPVIDPCDLDGNGFITYDDVEDFLFIYGIVDLGGIRGVLPGDGNLDGYVDGLDFLIWNDNKFTQRRKWSQGNYNFDLNGVDGSDFVVWNFYKFQSIFP